MVAAVALLMSNSNAQAGDLADIFADELAGLELEPVGPVLANTIASTYPVASASSSVTYVFNPATETFERQTRVLGPLIGERAETIGKGQVNLALSYSYVRPKSINGEDLDSLVNTPEIDGQVVSFPVPDGVTLADDRFSNFLPIFVDADFDIEAQILTPGITYGVTPDLDINVTLPLIRTFLRVTADTIVPDPRLPEFTLRPGDPNAQQGHRFASDDSVGVGDFLVRAKYVFLRERPVDLAAGLGLSIPTGDQGDFQGTDTTRLQPSLIVSRVFAERFEPLLNVGLDITAEDVDRSSLRWAAGGTAQIYGPLTGALVFLGRNEFNEQSDPIESPFFFQIERNDIFDVSAGLRYLLGENGVIGVNFIVPLNDDGFRADFIPTVVAEYVFSDPGK
jgi:hypothetical protein